MAPVVHTIQPTFAGGEFAPSLYSRVDLQKYGTGLKRSKNGYVHPHGGWSNRPGTKFVRETKFSDKLSRIVSFEFSTTQAYGIEFGHLYARFHTNGGTVLEPTKTITGATAANPVVITSNAHGYSNGDQVVIEGVVGMTQLNGLTFTVANKTANTYELQGINGSAYTAYSSGGTSARIYEVVTPFTETDLANLKFTQSADVLYIVHPTFAPRTLSRFGDIPPDWRLELFTFTDGPFMVSNIKESHTLTLGAVSGAGVTLVSTEDIFDTGHVGALFRLRHQLQGSAYKATLAATTNGTALNCGGTWRLITLGGWGGTLEIEKSIDGGSNWTRLRQFSSTAASSFNYNTFGTDEGQFLVRAKYTHVDGTINVELTTDPYEHTGIVKIATVVDAKNATCNVITRAGDTVATFDWAEGSWSDFNGWPTAVAFYQDRLCFAGSDSEPQTFWTSQTGTYSNFGRSTPLVDSDAISVSLPSRKLNGIRNLAALQEVVCLTSATDWSIGPPAGGPVTPTSIDTKLHGYRGSSGVDPVVVGNRLVYVQPQGSVVRDMGYNYQVAGFDGDNISIFANHLFEGFSVVEMAYQQEPDSLVWLVRSDGKMLSLTYIREQEVQAWCWHETDGNFESVCCLPASGFDELWMIVKRGSKRFVERMARRMASTDPRDQFFVDAGLTYDLPKTITGVTAANPPVVTSTAHGFSNGDLVDILNITWQDDSEDEQPDQLNGYRFKIKNKTANTFELTDEVTGVNIDGSAYLAYVSGGEVRKVVSSVSGLSHLEGETVAILANGNVHTEQVVTNGAVTLSPAASIVHVGMPYESDFQTLSVELRLDDGTTQDRRVQIPSVTLQLLNSRGGYIGSSADRLTEIKQRRAEPMGSPIELFTGSLEHVVANGYKKGASVFVRQKDPLPITILSAMPKVEAGG